MKKYTIQIAFLAICVIGLLNACAKQKTANFNNEKIAVDYVPARDYQVELIEDSILIFDGNRFVGKLPIHWDKPTELDSLFMKDNE